MRKSLFIIKKGIPQTILMWKNLYIIKMKELKLNNLHKSKTVATNSKSYNYK